MKSCRLDVNTECTLAERIRERSLLLDDLEEYQ